MSYFYFHRLLSNEHVNIIKDQFNIKDLQHVNGPLLSRNQLRLDNKIVKTIIEDLFNRCKAKIGDTNMKFDPSYIEVRSYFKDDYFDWHIDYETMPKADHPIYEFVVTLDNASDSLTEVKNNDKIDSFKTSQGDVFIVTRHGAEHRVTKVTTGYRTIIKFRSL